jgi:hypothetical protein
MKETLKLAQYTWIEIVNRLLLIYIAILSIGCGQEQGIESTSCRIMQDLKAQDLLINKTITEQQEIHQAIKDQIAADFPQVSSQKSFICTY